MCGNCVMDNVKQRMMSRRNFIAAAAIAGAALSLPPATPANAQAPPADTKVAPGGTRTVHDMTHELHPDFPTYFGPQQLFMEQKFKYSEHKFNLFELRINEHTGTHIDAPLHFSPDGKSVAEIPVSQLVVPLAIVDIRDRASTNFDAQLTPDDIKAWTARNGPLPRNCCVAMNSGWDAHVTTSKFRNSTDGKTMHFPGFHVETAKMLIEDGNAIGIASDTLSLDFGASPDFATHYAWLPSGRSGLECIANLSALPPAGATLIVGAPKVRGGTGGPARVMALL